MDRKLKHSLFLLKGSDMGTRTSIQLATLVIIVFFVGCSGGGGGGADEDSPADDDTLFEQETFDTDMEDLSDLEEMASEDARVDDLDMTDQDSMEEVLDDRGEEIDNSEELPSEADLLETERFDSLEETDTCDDGDPCTKDQIAADGFSCYHPPFCDQLNQSICELDQGVPSCLCDPSYQDYGDGVCKPSNPCLTDSTCLLQHRACSNDQGTAVCGECLIGYHQDEERYFLHEISP